MVSRDEVACSAGPQYWPGPRLRIARETVARAGLARGTSSADRAGAGLVALTEQVQLPLPFSGGLGDRWLWLAEVAAADLSVARLFEGHTDAAAILSEAGRRIDPARRFGVWASKAGGTSVTATAAGADLVLRGSRPYASGASSIDTALLTVDRGNDELLVAVDLSTDGMAVEEGSWRAIGMAGSDSVTVHLDGVRVGAGEVIGPPGFYLDRPGFWVGAVGVAACWFGGAVGVCQPLVRAAVEGRLDTHGLAALGRTWADLEAAAALFATTADMMDGGRHLPAVTLRRLAETVRAQVERAAVDTIESVGRSLGPGPLTADRVHAQRVADLGVYVRQHHAGRDLAELGRLLGERAW